MVLIDDDEHGQIDLDQLDTELAHGAAMMAMTHIPTSGGLINPAEEVGALCRKHGVFYVLDACQSVGQVPLDVDTIGCDVLSGTGRKYLRGPRGTGFLYAGERALDVLEPPFIDLHSADWIRANDYEWRSDARRFENWETYYAGKAGLGAAIEYALGLGIDVTGARLADLAARLRVGLESLERVAVHDKGARRGGIVTFTVDGVDATSVHAQLLARRINTSTSGPDRARLDLEPRGLPTVIRASTHYYNSEDEIDAVIAAVDEGALTLPSFARDDIVAVALAPGGRARSRNPRLGGGRSRRLTRGRSWGRSMVIADLAGSGGGRDAAADPIARAGIPIDRCWDVSAVHRLLDGGWRAPLGLVWASPPRTRPRHAAADGPVGAARRGRRRR